MIILNFREELENSKMDRSKFIKLTGKYKGYFTKVIIIKTY